MRLPRFAAGYTAALSLVLFSLLAAPLAGQQQAAEDEVILHLGGIQSTSAQPPRSQGLLAIAMSEALAASRHADLAAQNTDDLDAMKLHARHVLHALDPERVPDAAGPGIGHGTIQAAEDISTHINLALEVENVSQPTSENLRTHGPAIAQSAETVARWSRQMIGLVERIRMAESAAEAEPLVEELQVLADRVEAGEDLNGDGQVRWEDGEGGMLQVQEHTNLLMAEIGE